MKMLKSLSENKQDTQFLTLDLSLVQSYLPLSLSAKSPDVSVSSLISSFHNTFQQNIIWWGSLMYSTLPLQLHFSFFFYKSLDEFALQITYSLRLFRFVGHFPPLKWCYPSLWPQHHVLLSPKLSLGAISLFSWFPM